MASIANFLPRPKNSFSASISTNYPQEDAGSVSVSVENVGPPVYRHRKNWVPRTQADFGDGGAFPEIHVAQYPLQLGRKHRKQTGNTVALRVDESGSIQYDALAREGHHSKELVQTSLSSIKPIDVGEFERPAEEDVQNTTEKTKLALEKIVDLKVRAHRPKSIQQTSQKPQYIRYTPQQAEAGIQDRLIRMVEIPVDPFEPPRFKHKKIPKGPGSPPAPIMHSPPRKISVEEQKAWFVPPCVSNWKNSKGYTIPLDKRLAADGRDLQEIKINDNFAKLAEALYIADRNAREEVSARAKMMMKQAEKEKESKETYLRELASKAREEREAVEAIQERGRSPSASPQARESFQDLKERERLRKETEREVRREMRLANAGRLKEDRDVSEKIALGMAKPTLTGESLYDQRLFNQTQGVSSGFGAEDSYNLYDKPLFQTNNTIYKPKNLSESDMDVETIMKENRFVPDRGFKGTEEPAGEREGPVQFVKADPFEIDAFLSGEKRPYGLEGSGKDSREETQDKKRKV